MSLTQRLELKQTQQLVMTPQLQQAIRMLQMSNAEIHGFLAEEIERNPMLELARPGAEVAPAAPAPAGDSIDALGGVGEALEGGRDNLYEAADAPPPASTLQAGGETHYSWSTTGPGGGFAEASADFADRLSGAATLREHLIAQISLASADDEARALALLLVDHLDGAGYLAGELDEIGRRLGAPPAALARALALLQSCEPTGVGARDLSECLALQLAERDRLDPAMRALLGRLEDLAAARFDALRAACGVDDEDLAEMIAEIRALDPRPGAAFDHFVAQTVTPDVFVRRNDLGGWSVEVNADALPRVLMDTRYAAELDRAGKTAALSFVAECRQNAAWLIRALDQRAQTILKVASEIVKQQQLFFREGVAGLRPMTLRMVADAIGMHESTVSRVTANKYMATERGVFELKFFFTQAIAAADGGDAHSAEAVRRRIRDLISAEEPRRTLSDDQLVKMLGAEGVTIARRTVAKYREGMNIPSSVRRRRLKAAALQK